VFAICLLNHFCIPIYGTPGIKISYLFNQIVFHNFHPLYVVGILWVTEPYEIKDHIQEYQNTRLQNINQTGTYIWGRDMGAV